MTAREICSELSKTVSTTILLNLTWFRFSFVIISRLCPLFRSVPFCSVLFCSAVCISSYFPSRFLSLPHPHLLFPSFCHFLLLLALFSVPGDRSEFIRPSFTTDRSVETSRGEHMRHQVDWISSGRLRYTHLPSNLQRALHHTALLHSTTSRCSAFLSPTLLTLHECLAIVTTHCKESVQTFLLFLSLLNDIQCPYLVLCSLTISLWLMIVTASNCFSSHSWSLSDYCRSVLPVLFLIVLDTFRALSTYISPSSAYYQITSRVRSQLMLHTPAIQILHENPCFSACYLPSFSW